MKAAPVLSMFVALVLAGLAPAAEARGSLFPHPRIATGDAPVAMVAEDFDGDGWPDLVTANLGSDDLSLLRGAGEGSFAYPSAVAVGDDPYAIVTGDFNGDGSPDLAVANKGSDDLSVLLGNGDGTFAADQRYEIRYDPRSLVPGDFDEDGTTDLAVAGNYNIGISILLGRGDGTFGPATEYFAQIHPQQVLLGDFNEDGHQDLLVTSDTGQPFSLLLGLGNGGFGAPMIGSLPNRRLYGAAVEDFDEDGHLDLAMNWSGDVSLLPGRGDGTFSDEIRLGVRGIPLAAGDLNDDGHVDLVLTYSGEVNVVLGHGDGSFAEPASFAFGGYRPRWIEIEDLNADGLPDLALANNGSDDVDILLGRGDGTFETESWSHFDGGWKSHSIVQGDLDGDGHLDLVTAGEYTVWPLPGRGDGAFGPSTWTLALEDMTSVTIGEFNGDGSPDLAMVGGALFYEQENLGILLGRGDGGFHEKEVLAWGLRRRAVVAGDLDGDGNQDLVTVGESARHLEVRFGTGDGSFGGVTLHGVGDHPVAIAMGDFNADPHLDLATANQTSDDVSILLGTGGGGFAGELRFPTGEYQSVLAAGDLNADGVQDLVVSRGRFTQESELILLLGNGDGTVSVPQSVALGDSSTSLAIEDLDGDGHLDVAAAITDQYAVQVLLGDGGGGLTSIGRFGVAERVEAVVSGDYDEDGRNDLAVVTYWGDVVVLLNQGSANQPPVADAGEDTVVECASPAGAVITLDGSISSDPDSTPGTNDDIVLYEWFSAFGTGGQTLLETGMVSGTTFSLGHHTVTLRVTDSRGETDTDEVEVEVRDTTAPAVSVEVSPDTLWPPNHRMVTVQARVTAEDLCGGSDVVLASVAGGEPHDIQDADIGSADFELRLRAERDGAGEGRTYTLTYTATDGAGNTASASAIVVVPHDRRGPAGPPAAVEVISAGGSSGCSAARPRPEPGGSRRDGDRSAARPR